MPRYLNIMQDTKRDPVPSGPVPHAPRELPEPAQDVSESESSEDEEAQNSSQDEDSEPKLPDDENSNQISDEDDSDVRTNYYLLTFIEDFL